MWQLGRVVFLEDADSVVVDVSHEAGGGVEIFIFRFVGSAEIVGRVGESLVAGCVRSHWEGRQARRGMFGGGRGGVGGCGCRHAGEVEDRGERGGVEERVAAEEARWG